MIDSFYNKSELSSPFFNMKVNKLFISQIYLRSELSKAILRNPRALRDFENFNLTKWANRVIHGT